MKHKTLIVTKIVSGLFQQEMIDQKKRNHLLQSWNKGVASYDLETLKKVFLELRACTDNPHWLKDINQCLEELEII